MDLDDLQLVDEGDGDVPMPDAADLDNNDEKGNDVIADMEDAPVIEPPSPRQESGDEEELPAMVVPIPSLKPGQKHNKPRTIGLVGPWIKKPEALQAKIIDPLDAAPGILKFEGVRIERLRYPSEFAAITHTCIFDGRTVDDVVYRFRLEDPRTNGPTAILHPFQESRRFGTSASHMPGVDPALVYTLWCTERASTQPDVPDIYVIIHTEAEVDKQKLSLGGAGGKLGAAILDKLRHPQIGPLGQRKLVNQLGAHSKRDNQLTLVLHQRPIYRIMRCPLLFYLWPQRDLMSLPWSGFVAVADALERGTCPLSSFCFPWMLPRNTLKMGTLDTMDLRTLHALLECERPQNNLADLSTHTTGVDNPNATISDVDRCLNEMRREELCVEFFTHACEGAKREGHTYSNMAQLATFYIRQVRQNHANLTVNTLVGIPESKPMRAEHLAEGLKSWRLMQYAHSLGIIQIVAEYSAISNNTLMEPAVYSGDDWLKQTQFVTFVRTIVEQRWRRSIHADGCVTVEDVFNKIRRPPRQVWNELPPGAPRWGEPNFQREFAKLDPTQKTAVAKAVINAVSLICGRPGTGKTQVFRTLFFLFGGKNEGGVVPMAAYGRIASMLRDRLDQWAHTFHRAAALVSYVKDAPDSKLLQMARTWMWDEGGVATHHHGCLSAGTMGRYATRLVIAGDRNQMPAIGSGTFFDSLVSVLSNEPDRPRYTELSIPWRFITQSMNAAGKPALTPEEAARRRPEIDEDLATDWNMRIVLNNQLNMNSGLLDLVFTSDLQDRKARFVLINAGRGFTWINRCLEAVLGEKKIGKGLVSATAFSDCKLQLVAQRHNECKAINRHVYEVLYGVTLAPTAADPWIRVGERVTFVKNGYFVPGDKSADNLVTDEELDRLALTAAAIDNREGADVADYLANVFADNGNNPVAAERDWAKKQLTDKRDHIYRGFDSDDVFNGEIRTLMRVVDVDATSGNIVEEYEHVKGSNVVGRGARNRAAAVANNLVRLLIFNDDKQLFITPRYELDQVVRAYCITSKKMQGSESEIVINYVTPANSMQPWRMTADTVHREELYTNMTRARKQFICVVPIPTQEPHELLTAVREICSNPAPVRRNSFARYVQFGDFGDPQLPPSPTTAVSKKRKVERDEEKQRPAKKAKVENE